MRVLLAALLLAGCTTAAPASAPRDPVFDPRRVDDLPAGQVAGLPHRVAPPRTAPALADHPVPAAVLSVHTDHGVLLLSTEGEWRRVPAPRMGSFGGAELTRDGTRVAVETADGAVAWDLPTGKRTRVPNPPRSRPWDYSSWRWVDHETLLLDDRRGGWRVDPATGTVRRTAYPSRTSFWWTVDPDGAVLESADWSHPNVLTDWATGEAREVSMEPTGRLASIHADEDTVVGTSYDGGPFAVHVADRSDLTSQHRLRVRDHEANYSNGGLSVVALLGDGRPLLRVAVLGGRGEHWRLVTWGPETDDLALVTRGRGALLSLAEGLLGHLR